MSLIKATARHNFNFIIKLPTENLTLYQFKTQKQLLKKKTSLFRKQIKGTLLDKRSSVTVIEEILNDNTRFSKLEIPTG